jgi:tetratricopeptide (TPR) repeat protein
MSQVAADALVEEAQQLLRLESFAQAAERFERAAQLFPPHANAWKGLGHALLCLGRPHDAAHAFDRSIGLRPDSATALWGGAVAHAEIGNKVVAQSYLRRALVLQPSWLLMAQDVPQLAPYLELSTRTAELLHVVFGAFATRTYRHADGDAPPIEVGRIASQPAIGQVTYVSVGLSNHTWAEPERPRVELVLATSWDDEVCGLVLANLAFHLAATNYFPAPGVMVRDVLAAITASDLSQRLPHVYIAVPRAWGLDLPLADGPPAITLAQVVPVSEAEHARWRADVAAFDAYLATIDVADLKRV